LRETQTEPASIWRRSSSRHPTPGRKPNGSADEQTRLLGTKKVHIQAILRLDIWEGHTSIWCERQGTGTGEPARNEPTNVERGQSVPSHPCLRRPGKKWGGERCVRGVASVNESRWRRTHGEREATRTKSVLFPDPGGGEERAGIQACGISLQR